MAFGWFGIRMRRREWFDNCINCRPTVNKQLIIIHLRRFKTHSNAVKALKKTIEVSSNGQWIDLPCSFKNNFNLFLSLFFSVTLVNTSKNYDNNKLLFVHKCVSYVHFTLKIISFSQFALYKLIQCAIVGQTDQPFIDLLVEIWK